MFYMYGKKLSIDELADAICASASSLKNGTIKIIAEHVDENVFFSRVRTIKLLDYVLISYVLSNYFLHLAVFKRIQKSTIADILGSVLEHMKNFVNEDRSRKWSDDDILAIHSGISRYYELTLDYLKKIDKETIDDDIGTIVMDDLMDFYKLSIDEVSVLDRMFVTTYLNSMNKMVGEMLEEHKFVYAGT